MEYGGSKVPDRVFFIVDSTRLMQETDELKDAIVVYRPENDLKKANLEQRCSQLIGISFLATNLTGQVPKYIRLKFTGFAIKQLSKNYIMGLSGKVDEPKSSVIKYLEHMHDSFLFYYGSPDYVMETSVNEWDIFRSQMSHIFDCILDFTFLDGHSLPAMFSPLTYSVLDQRKGGTQLFLQSQRLLRLCQVHSCIVGGCLFYNGEILSNQLPSSLVKKLLLVACGGVELNSKSVLEDQIAPESVWVIDIYLTREELNLLDHLRRDHTNISMMYSSLTPHPVSSTMLLQDRAHRRSSTLDKLSKKKLLDRSISRSNQSRVNNSEDVSSSLSGSLNRSRRYGIDPLKKSLSRGHSLASDESTSPPPLPPMPASWQPRPPPLPARATQPPPVPQHSSQAPPIPLRKGSHNRQQDEEPGPPLPPRIESATLPPPVPPHGTRSVRKSIYDDLDDSASPDIPVVDNIRTSSPQPDSDGSEGFATPPAFHSPTREEFMSLTGVTTDAVHNHTVDEGTGTTKDNSIVKNQDSEEGVNGDLNVHQNKIQIGSVASTVDEIRRGSDDSQISHKSGEEVARNRTSTVSDSGSLVITQALSESPYSFKERDDEDISQEESEEEEDKIPTEDEGGENSLFPPVDMAEVRTHTPPVPEGTESASDGEGASLRKTLGRPRAETWIQRENAQTMSRPTMVKRCLYVQRCVNTVVVLLADTDLPNDHSLIQAMWKLLIGQLLQLNNSVEGCLIEKECLYSSDASDIIGTSSKHPPVQVFQAVHSNMTGTCSVSSLTAPYQFRHAVRRAHQEFSLDPNLRQMSLIKEHCKMITQNMMGRESYFQPSRITNIDTMTVHGQLEKYAKNMKRYPISMGVRTNFL